MTKNNTILVGIGGTAVSNKSGDVIKTFSLGSCIGLILISDNPRIVGMTHIALPDSKLDGKKASNMPGYFADTGFQNLIKEMKKNGLNGHGKLTVKLVGGANVNDPNNFFNIGKRNVLSIKKQLWQHRLYAQSEDTGGSNSRTTWVEVDTGKVYVSSPGQNVKEI